MSAHVTLLVCLTCGARHFLRIGESAPVHQHTWSLYGAATIEPALDGSVD